MNNVRYSYHRDPKDQKRVLCIARTINEDGSVSYGMSLNAPPRMVEDDWYGEPTKVGDTFQKKTARSLAEGRLRTVTRGGPLRGRVANSDNAPLRQVLEHLTRIKPEDFTDDIEEQEQLSGLCHKVNRIAKSAVKNMGRTAA